MQNSDIALEYTSNHAIGYDFCPGSVPGISQKQWSTKWLYFLLMSELYPLGPETTRLRALPPVELHLTLNVNVTASTSIAAVTTVTGGEESYKNNYISLYNHERWLLTGVEDAQS